MRINATRALTGMAGGLLLVLAACGEAATPADRDALIGVWSPQDGTGRIIEFKTNGEFDYRYFATLRMHWELSRKGRLDLSSVDGGVKWTCAYAIEGDLLSIDDGSGKTCVSPGVTPPEPMPFTFRKGA